MIPLAYPTQFTTYAVINVPDDDGTTFPVFNNSLVTVLAVDSKNITFFPILDLDAYGIYQSTTSLLDSCARAVFSPPTPPHERCSATVVQHHQACTFPLTADLAVVYSPAPHSFDLQCTDGVKQLTAATYIIDASDCAMMNTVPSGRHSIHLDTESAPAPLTNTTWLNPLAPINDEPNVNHTALRTQLHAIQQELEQAAWYQQPKTHATGSILMLILICIIGGCTYQRCNRQRLPLNPAMEMQQVIATAAESWSNLYLKSEAAH